jgi:hypothetical protein
MLKEKSNDFSLPFQQFSSRPLIEPIPTFRQKADTQRFNTSLANILSLVRNRRAREIRSCFKAKLIGPKKAKAPCVGPDTAPYLGGIIHGVVTACPELPHSARPCEPKLIGKTVQELVTLPAYLTRCRPDGITAGFGKQAPLCRIRFEFSQIICSNVDLVNLLTIRPLPPGIFEFFREKSSVTC